MLMPLREVRCVCNGLRLGTGGPECKWTQGRVVGTGGSALMMSWMLLFLYVVQA